MGSTVAQIDNSLQVEGVISYYYYYFTIVLLHKQNPIIENSVAEIHSVFTMGIHLLQPSVSDGQPRTVRCY